MFAKWLRRRNVWIAGAGVLLLLLVALALLRGRTAADSPQVAFSELLSDVDRGAVADVVVSGDVLDYKRTDGKTFRTIAPANYVTGERRVRLGSRRSSVRIDVRSAPERKRLQLRRAGARRSASSACSA